MMNKERKITKYMINFIIVSIVIFNLISIFILVKMLRAVEIKLKLFTTVILLVVNFILANIIYSIGQVSLLQEIAVNIKPFMIFILLPINNLLMACPIAIQVNKLSLEEIDKRKFIKNISIFIIIDILIYILEVMYLKNIQIGISNMKGQQNE